MHTVQGTKSSTHTHALAHAHDRLLVMGVDFGDLVKIDMWSVLGVFLKRSRVMVWLDVTNIQ